MDSGDSSSSEDDVDQTSSHNPEPPAELRQDLREADNIGTSVFSKQWLFNTLMNVIQVINKHSEKEDSPGPGGVELDEPMQDELCELWDMSMNSDVVSFLLEFSAIELFAGIITESKSPRATEICVGILGNMACNEEAAVKISQNKKLVDLVLMLLSDSDAPTLVEDTRLIQCCLSCEAARQTWLDALKADNMVLINLLFILSSSTNVQLLHNAANVVDKVMDVDEALCEQWSSDELIQGVLEAAKQVKMVPGETLDSLFHVLQLASSTQTGVTAIVEAAEPLSTLMLKHLSNLCSEEIVAVAGKENGLASAFSVLRIILVSWNEGRRLIVDEYQMLRCLVKILDVVYCKLFREQLAKSLKRSYSRRRTTSQGIDENEHEAAKNAGMEDDDKKDEENNSDCMSDSESSSSDGDYDLTRMNMLYGVIQDLAEDILLALIQVSTQRKADKDGSKSRHRRDNPPKSLFYLDSQCLKQRINYFIYMLQDVPFPGDASTADDASSSSQRTGLASKLSTSCVQTTQCHDALEDARGCSDEASKAAGCGSHRTQLEEPSHDLKSKPSDVEKNVSVTEATDHEEHPPKDDMNPNNPVNDDNDVSKHSAHDTNSRSKQTYVDKLLTLASDYHLHRLSHIIKDVLEI